MSATQPQENQPVTNALHETAQSGSRQSVGQPVKSGYGDRLSRSTRVQAARAGMAERMAADAAQLWPDLAATLQDTAAPTDTATAPDAQTSDTSASGVSGRAAPPDQTRTERDQPPPQPNGAAATEEKQGAKPTALTLTEEELQARIAEATARERANVSALQQKLNEEELRRQSREAALGQIMTDYQGTEVETAARRHWQTGDQMREAAIAEQQRAVIASQQQAAALTQEATRQAEAMRQQLRSELLHQAGRVGISPEQLDGKIAELLTTDPQASVFTRRFSAARNLSEATEAAGLAYTLVRQPLAVWMQSASLERIREQPENQPPDTTTERVQPFGSGGAVSADPYAHIKKASDRARARVRAATAEAAKRVFNIE